LKKKRLPSKRALESRQKKTNMMSQKRTNKKIMAMLAWSMGRGKRRNQKKNKNQKMRNRNVRK
jgi:hypothetical protein